MGRNTSNKLMTAENARKDFLREVESRRGWFGLKTNEALGTACGMTKATMRNRLLDPDSLTVSELRGMVQRLGLDFEIVACFVGYDIKTVNKAKKLREEEAQCLNS